MCLTLILRLAYFLGLRVPVGCCSSLVSLGSALIKGLQNPQVTDAQSVVVHPPNRGLPPIYSRVHTRLPLPPKALVAPGLDHDLTSWAASRTKLYGRDVRRVPCLPLVRHGHSHATTMLETLRITSFARVQLVVSPRVPTVSWFGQQ